MNAGFPFFGAPDRLKCGFPAGLMPVMMPVNEFTLDVTDDG